VGDECCLVNSTFEKMFSMAAGHLLKKKIKIKIEN
jgi:hypothetical protein